MPRRNDGYQNSSPRFKHDYRLDSRRCWADATARASGINYCYSNIDIGFPNTFPYLCVRKRGARTCERFVARAAFSFDLRPSACGSSALTSKRLARLLAASKCIAARRRVHRDERLIAGLLRTSFEGTDIGIRDWRRNGAPRRCRGNIAATTAGCKFAEARSETDIRSRVDEDENNGYGKRVEPRGTEGDKAGGLSRPGNYRKSRRTLARLSGCYGQIRAVDSCQGCN